MHIAPDFLLVGLLSPKNFTLRNVPPTLSFCAVPKGEVAESIIQKINIAHRERENGLRSWVRAKEENFLPPLSSRPEGELLHREKVFLCFLKLWILQLWASPACRMTRRKHLRVAFQTSEPGFRTPLKMLSFCAEPKAESQNPSSRKGPSPSEIGGTASGG